MPKRKQDLPLEMECVRDQLLAAIQRHEREEHDGELCGEERLKAAAFFAHCLGLEATKHNAILIVKLMRQLVEANEGQQEEYFDLEPPF